MTSRGDHTRDSGGVPDLSVPVGTSSGLTGDFVSCINKAFTDDKANIMEMHDSSIPGPDATVLIAVLAFGWWGGGGGGVRFGRSGEEEEQELIQTDGTETVRSSQESC